MLKENAIVKTNWWVRGMKKARNEEHSSQLNSTRCEACKGVKYVGLYNALGYMHVHRVRRTKTERVKVKEGLSLQRL